MNFFKTISSSVWSPTFYQNLKEKKIGSMLWYFVRLSLLLAIISACIYAPMIFAFFSQTTVDAFIAEYPSDLVVTIANGKASVNKPEPYLIKSGSDDKVKNFLVIDTKSEFSAKQFIDYSTHALLKKDSLIVADNGGLKITPLTEIKNFTLSREVLVGWGAKLAPYLGWGAAVLSLLLWLLIASAYSFTLIYLFFVALIVLLLSYFFKWQLSYKDSYKVALYAATLPMIITALLPIVHLQAPFFSFTLLLLIIVVINFFNRPKDVFNG